jgi:hypothetical protein
LLNLISFEIEREKEKKSFDKFVKLSNSEDALNVKNKITLKLLYLKIEMFIFLKFLAGFNIDGHRIGPSQFTGSRSGGVHPRLGRAPCRYGICIKFSLYN